MNQQIRFCTSFDGTRIAYATTGSGPALVRAPHWFTHLEHDWNNPAMLPWVAGLSRHFSLLRFDQRGTGLSDRDAAEISFEAWVRDLECVVDAAGIERFALVGLSQGAAIATAYAARNPSRVSHLVLYGSYARGWKRRDTPQSSLEQFETLAKLVEVGWSGDDPSFRQVFTTQFMPDASSAAIQGFNRMMPLSSSAQSAARIYRAFGEIDVQDDARRIACPALVLHVRGDLRSPFDEGRRLAALIPGARFVPLESRNHLLMESEPAFGECLAAIVDFCGGTPGNATQTPFAELTPREREVLELIARGLDNAQVAAHLELSEKTVRNNITRIFDKLQVENRGQAIVRAREAGMGTGSAQRA